MKRLAPLVLLLAVVGCRGLDDRGVFPMVEADDGPPRLRYPDGQVSLNRTCMIRLSNRLNPRMPPAFVNGRPLGFC